MFRFGILMVAISALLGAAFFCFTESHEDAAASEVNTKTQIALPLTRARGYEKLVYAATDIRRGVEIREEMLVEKPPPLDGFSIAAIGAKRFVVGKRPIQDIAAGETQIGVPDRRHILKYHRSSAALIAQTIDDTL
jgi:hypothetical protein